VDIFSFEVDLNPALDVKRMGALRENYAQIQSMPDYMLEVASKTRGIITETSAPRANTKRVMIRQDRCFFSQGEGLSFPKARRAVQG